MEENIFRRPEVVRVLEKFVEVRLHTDAESDSSRELLALKRQRLAGNEALPIYEIVDPQTGQQLDKFEGADLPSGARFTAWLEQFLLRAKKGK